MFNSLFHEPTVIYLIFPIITGVLVILIGYYIFGIGKQKKGSQRKSTAILNNGKGNKFLNNSIVGFDVGIEDNGEDTIAERNIIIGKKSK